MLKFSFELRFYVILTYIIRLVMHERGKISKNDENPSKNDKKLQNGPKKLSRYAQSGWIRVYK